MIFLDETGKRWRRIKLGAGLLGSSTAIPVVVLSAAALLYLPSWGSFSLPKPLGITEPHVKSAHTSQPSSPSTQVRQQTSDGSSKPANNTRMPLVSESSQPVLNSTTPSTPITAAPTTQLPTPPAQSGLGVGNQPDQQGKSDYGRSHQPTRS